MLVTRTSALSGVTLSTSASDEFIGYNTEDGELRIDGQG